MENTRSSISSKPSVEVRSPARPRFRADRHLVGAPAIRAGATGPGGQSVPGCARRGRRRARSHCLTVAIGTAGFTYKCSSCHFPRRCRPGTRVTFLSERAPGNRRVDKAVPGAFSPASMGWRVTPSMSCAAADLPGFSGKTQPALWTRSPRTATGHETPLLQRSFGSPCEVSHTHLVQ
jgi:hypothetical protein